MSDAAVIPSGHQRMVWVFSVDMSMEELDGLIGQGLADALGLWREPDNAHVESFEAATLNAYGLANYISEACGMTVDATQAAELDALHGTVLLIYSKALSPQEAAFDPDPPFTLVGRFGTAPAIPSMSSLPSASAAGLLPQGKPPKSDARMSGMVATLVLLFLALFVGFFVWMAS